MKFINEARFINEAKLINETNFIKIPSLRFIVILQKCNFPFLTDKILEVLIKIKMKNPKEVFFISDGFDSKDLIYQWKKIDIEDLSSSSSCVYSMDSYYESLFAGPLDDTQCMRRADEYMFFARCNH